ncbi:MAG TPA: hypothetical protein VF185_04265 [Patescibacteria group bacterium]
MKKIINIATILAILILDLLILAMAIQFPPSILKNFITICDTKNLGSWSADQALPQYFRSTSVTGKETIFEASYVNTDKTITLSCKTKILVSDLYQAKNLYARILANQQTDVLISLSRKGNGGPRPTPTTIKPNKNGDPNIVWINLDSKDRPKINWLTGDYDTVQLRFTNFDTTKELNIKIDEIYIK